MIQSCYISFDKYKDDPNSICSRISTLDISSKKYTPNFNKYKENYNSNKYENTKMRFKNFYTDELSYYQGDLYDRINCLYQCLNILIYDFQKNEYLDEFLTFYYHWTNFNNNDNILYKYQLIHSINRIFRKIYNDHKQYLNSSIVNEIEEFHKANLNNNTYYKIKKMFKQQNLNYSITKKFTENVNPTEIVNKDINLSFGKLNFNTNDTSNTDDNDEWQTKTKNKKKNIQIENNSNSKNQSINNTFETSIDNIHSDEVFSDISQDDLETIIDIQKTDNNLRNEDINNTQYFNDDCLLKEQYADEIGIIEPSLEFVQFEEIVEEEQNEEEYSSDDYYYE